MVELFKGPGGWSEAVKALGLPSIGIELDAAACETSRCAGHRVTQGDVAALDPKEFAPARGLIASAPCQPFSMAGLGAGRQALGAYAEEIEHLLERGEWALDRDRLREVCDDPRADLVLEPLRWAMALRPVWIALEQVEPVLPLWEVMGGGIREMGYSVWTGVVSAEVYGVPQTRRRAILLARCDGKEARRPPATHQRFIPPRRKDVQADSLFDAPEPERIIVSEDRDLLPWVSMAEALGWPEADILRTGHNTMKISRDPQDMVPYERVASSPSPTVKASALGAWKRGPEGSHIEPPMRWKSNDRANATERSVTEPAPTITGGHDHEERVWLRAGTNGHDTARRSSEPAPTLRFGARLNTVEWVEYNSRDQRDSRGSEPVPARRRPVAEPAPTIAGQSYNDSWVTRRPATTVAGDPRVHPPGHKRNSEDEAADRDGYEGRAGENAIRVTVEEAAALQTFRAGYPWQGTRTKIFEQIGNAVPPVMALALLREVTS